MGSGKTSWAIQMMNEHPEESFVYCTPLLDEISRIKNATTSTFYEPEYKGGGRKIDNFNELLRDECNIAVSHSTFSNATEDTSSYIFNGNYTLILDEVIDVLVEYNKLYTGKDQKRKGDVRLLLDKGLIQIDNYGYVSWIGDSYEDSTYAEVERLAKRGNLLYLDNSLFLWEFPSEIFEYFDNVYVLTYLFEGSYLKPFFEYHKIKYDLTSVSEDNGKYYLSAYCCYTEDRLKYKDLIHIYDDADANRYENGNLSKSWFKRSKAQAYGTKNEIRTLKNRISNYLRNKCSAQASQIMWTTYKDYRSDLSGAGYTCVHRLTAADKKLPEDELKILEQKSSCFVPCNARATNAFRDRDVLVYAINQYSSPFVLKFFTRKNTPVNEEAFAVSSLLQWIWRSAIRDGKEIQIYIPSQRMRNLLNKWFEGRV
jgi:hypothetical protein